MNENEWRTDNTLDIEYKVGLFINYVMLSRGKSIDGTKMTDGGRGLANGQKIMRKGMENKTP